MYKFFTLKWKDVFLTLTPVLWLSVNHSTFAEQFFLSDKGGKMRVDGAKQPISYSNPKVSTVKTAFYWSVAQICGSNSHGFTLPSQANPLIVPIPLQVIDFTAKDCSFKNWCDQGVAFKLKDFRVVPSVLLIYPRKVPSTTWAVGCWEGLLD